MTDKVCEFLKEEDVKKFVDSMETFIFDCDGRWIQLWTIQVQPRYLRMVRPSFYLGVLWNGIGVIDGAVEVLHELRKLVRVLFFSAVLVEKRGYRVYPESYMTEGWFLWALQQGNQQCSGEWVAGTEAISIQGGLWLLQQVDNVIFYFHFSG